MAPTSTFCEPESILRIIRTEFNTPTKVILLQVLPLKCKWMGDTDDLHFGKREGKAILLGRASSRRWGSKGSCITWSKSED